MANIWCYYNYLEPKSNIGHYCLIRSNKQEGINESNFRKMWNRCNERNVKKKTQKPYANNTYIFDIETCKDVAILLTAKVGPHLAFNKRYLVTTNDVVLY